jgi:hypothetical protein
LSKQITGLGKSKGGSAIGEIQGCKTEKEKADAFNECYANIAPELANSVPTPNENVHFKVERMLSKMLDKKSFSSDLISNKTLKFIAREISWPLSHLVNLSVK